MHGTLLCHSWVVKNNIHVALMGQNVLATVTLLWIQRRRRYHPPTWQSWKCITIFRNSICLIKTDLLVLASKNDLWGAHWCTCRQCSPLHLSAWRALPWKGSQSLNALAWVDQTPAPTGDSQSQLLSVQLWMKKEQRWRRVGRKQNTRVVARLSRTASSCGC